MNFAHFGNVEWTDNAHVQQHITPVNARVGGFIKEIRFNEFQTVHKGDTLVIIEDAEFRLALAQAEAGLAQTQAGSRATNTGMETTQSNIDVTDANIEELRATMDNAQREDARFQKLLEQQSATQQQTDNVHTAYLTAHRRHSMTLVKSEQGHHIQQSQAAIDVARAQVKLARLNLSYTVIVATADGVLGRKNIHEGQLIQPGQTMVDIVDSKDLWIVANYRETQLPHLIPQDNATGNFVKVEQRVPVRISLERNKPQDLQKLRAGLNVECEIMY